MKWSTSLAVLATVALTGASRGAVFTDDFSSYTSQAELEARYDISAGGVASAVTVDLANDEFVLASDSGQNGGWAQAIDTANTASFTAGDSLAVEVGTTVVDNWTYFRFGIAAQDGSTGLMVQMESRSNTTYDDVVVKVVRGIGDGSYTEVADATVTGSSNKIGTWRVEIDSTNLTVLRDGAAITGLENIAHGADFADYASGARAAVNNMPSSATGKASKTVELDSITFEIVPEPTSLTLLGMLGMLGMAAASRRTGRV